jgi:hypothetical protein
MVPEDIPMKTRSYLASIALSALFAAACNPVVSGGGSGGQGGSGATASTTGSGAMGGGCDGTGGSAPDPCAGLSCGDPCDPTPCDPSQGPCPDVFEPESFCDANGQCTPGQPVCQPPPPPSCTSGAECDFNDTACQPCWDGSSVCLTGTCVDGQCVLNEPACPPQPSCTVSTDCPTPASCYLCPDGHSVACAAAECVSGLCTTTPGVCPAE